MPHYLLYIVLNHSILFPVAAGIIRFKYLGADFRPFVILIWFGALNDSLSVVLAYTLKTNALNGNLYVLAEFFWIMFIFYRWNNGKTGLYVFGAGIGAAVWALDNFIIHSITDNNSIFRIFYSVILVFLSVDRFNKLIVFEKNNLYKNPQFLVCTAFVVFYFCKAFAEIFNAYKVPFDNTFYMHLWLGLAVVNCLSNITYGIAILWIPKKQEFTLLY